MRVFAAALTLVLVTPSVARAEEFLGVEGDDSAPAAEPPPRELPKSTKRAATANNDRDDGNEGTFSFSGALSAGGDSFGGQVTIGYSFNPYVGVDTTYAYHRMDGDHDANVQYGPDVALILRGANPTMITPFVGAGPGFTKWQRKRDGEVFDADQSMTTNVFGGINLAFTRHFGLQIARRQLTYVEHAPKLFGEPTKRENPTQLSTSVGFYMAF